MNKSTNNKLLGSGLLLAISSSLCCLLPFLALFGSSLGSVSTAFSWIEPFRPYILAATALLLILAFYHAYRPQTIAPNCPCTDKKTFWGPKARLWTVTIATLILVSFPYATPYFQQKTTNQPPINVNNHATVVLPIQGMTCPSCETHVNTAILHLKGIQSVTTSYERAEAEVRFDTTQISNIEIERAIERETTYKVIKK